MTLDERCHVLRTAVAHLKSVFVEDLLQAGCFGEMLSDQAKELLADVRFDALAKRWCKPTFSIIRKLRNLFIYLIYTAQ